MYYAQGKKQLLFWYLIKKWCIWKKKWRIVQNKGVLTARIIVDNSAVWQFNNKFCGENVTELVVLS